MRRVVALWVLATGLAAVGFVRADAPADLATLQSRAQAGDAVALNELGNAYANGQGVPQDFAKATQYYAAAADKGYAVAQFNLGLMAELGHGAPQDLTKAFRYYRMAAEQGIPPAQYNVGNMYANGIGTSRNDAEAAKWMRQAAEHEIPEAQFYLGTAFDEGRGVAKDDVQALRWYQAASSAGYAPARYNLAVLLEAGRGAPANPSLAGQLFRAAAQQDFGPAQRMYGLLLIDGRDGLTADPVEAYAWLALSVGRGMPSADRDALGKKLSAAQLAAGQERAKALAASFANPLAADAPSAADALKAAQLDVQKLRAANEQLAGALQDAARERAELLRRIDALTKAADDQTRATASQNFELQSALKDARTAVDRLSTQNVQLQAAAQNNDVGPLRRNIDTLTQQLADKDTELTRVRAEASAASAESQRLARLAGASIANVAESSQVRFLAEDNRRLNSEIRRSTAELGNLYRQLRMAQSRLDQLGDTTKLDVSGEDPGLASLRRQNDDLRADNLRLTEQVRMASSTPAVSPDEIKALRDQLAAANAELAAKSSAPTGADLQRVQTQLADLTKQNADLEKRLAANTGSDAAEQVRKLQGDLAETQLALVAARRETEEIRVQLDAATTSLRAQAAKHAAEPEAARKK